MADKIAVLRLGRLEQFGRPLELYNHPANLFVAGFIGSPKMNFLAGTVAEDRTALVLPSGERIALPEEGFAQRAGQAATLGIRPTALRPDPAGALSIDVDTVEQLGGESYIYGTTRDGRALTMHSPGQTGVEIGETVTLGLPAEEIHLFDTESGLTLREGPSG